MKKNVPPSTKMVCLGIEIDTEKFMLSIPKEKLHQVVTECHLWIARKVCTKQQLQSILGLLLYVTKCVKRARFFLNRMVDTLKSAKNSKYIKLGQELRKYILWFHRFLIQFKGTVFFNPSLVSGVFEIDACMQGWVGRFNNQAYYVSMAQIKAEYNICHLEMLNVLVS